jgi:hypothetical protein
MSRQALSRLGYVGIAAGVLGALSAVVLLAWPPQTAPGPVRYPFTAGGFQVAQAWFFVQHWGLVAVLAGLAGSGAAGRGRIARGGLWVALAGTVALAGCELLAISYKDADFKVANAGLMGTAYGISSSAIGAGMVLAGVGILRSRRWTGWHRWIPLAIGVAEFAILTPTLFLGFVAARIGIGSWMLLFALLGWSLRAEARAGTADGVSSTERASGSVATGSGA